MEGRLGGLLIIQMQKDYGKFAMSATVRQTFPIVQSVAVNWKCGLTEVRVSGIALIAITERYW